jgi:hypothetical protein
VVIGLWGIVDVARDLEIRGGGNMAGEMGIRGDLGMEGEYNFRD